MVTDHGAGLDRDRLELTRRLFTEDHRLALQLHDGLGGHGELVDAGAVDREADLDKVPRVQLVAIVRHFDTDVRIASVLGCAVRTLHDAARQPNASSDDRGVLTHHDTARDLGRQRGVDPDGRLVDEAKEGDAGLNALPDDEVVFGEATGMRGKQGVLAVGGPGDAGRDAIGPGLGPCLLHGHGRLGVASTRDGLLAE